MPFEFKGIPIEAGRIPTAWSDVGCRYIQLFSRMQDVPWLQGLSEAEKNELEDLEWTLDVDDLLLFRSIAIKTLEAERIKFNQQLQARKQQQGIIGRLFG